MGLPTVRKLNLGKVVVSSSYEEAVGTAGAGAFIHTVHSELLNKAPPALAKLELCLRRIINSNR